MLGHDGPLLFLLKYHGCTEPIRPECDKRCERIDDISSCASSLVLRPPVSGIGKHGKSWAAIVPHSKSRWFCFDALLRTFPLSSAHPMIASNSLRDAVMRDCCWAQKSKAFGVVCVCVCLGFFFIIIRGNQCERLHPGTSLGSGLERLPRVVKGRRSHRFISGCVILGPEVAPRRQQVGSISHDSVSKSVPERSCQAGSARMVRLKKE